MSLGAVIQVQNPTYTIIKDGYVSVTPSGAVAGQHYEYILSKGFIEVSTTNVTTGLSPGSYTQQVILKQGATTLSSISQAFNLISGDVPDTSQSDINWINLVCCQYRLIEKYLEKKKIGDIDECCLWNRAHFLQALIDVLKRNTADDATQNCLNDVDELYVYQLAQDACNECNCNQDQEKLSLALMENQNFSLPG